MRKLTVSMVYGITMALIAGLSVHQATSNAVSKTVQSIQKNSTTVHSVSVAKTVSVVKPTVEKHVKVLVIGSSITYGWKDDKANGGYVVRAFKSLSAHTHVRYDVTNVAAPGTHVPDVTPRLQGWLNKYHPSVVVFAYGLLNDDHDHVPMAKVESNMKSQLSMVSKNHARSIIVTTPVSVSAEFTYKTTLPQYTKYQFAATKGFNNPSQVSLIDVFSQMKTYMNVHHNSINQVKGDNWHPNVYGHTVAGSILQQWLNRKLA